MSVARRKGDAGKSDMLFSRIVRSRGYCERCKVTGVPFDTAHIIPRRYSATRCVEDNAWCLCRSCHTTTGIFDGFHMELVERTIGSKRYWDLYRTAQERPPLSSKLWWQAERERLEARCDELGIDKKWKAAS